MIQLHLDNKLLKICIIDDTLVTIWLFLISYIQGANTSFVSVCLAKEFNGMECEKH